MGNISGDPMRGAVRIVVAEQRSKPARRPAALTYGQPVAREEPGKNLPCDNGEHSRHMAPWVLKAIELPRN